MSVADSIDALSGGLLTAAIARVKAEFLEMPGLHLTRPQAARLWGFDHAFCDIVLSALVEERFLTRTRSGSFMRARSPQPSLGGIFGHSILHPGAPETDNCL
jgi:hypothetical protein